MGVLSAINSPQRFRILARVDLYFEFPSICFGRTGKFDTETLYDHSSSKRLISTVQWMFMCAYVGDKYHFRGPIIAFNATLTIVGVTM